jgi:hypothetical protein
MRLKEKVEAYLNVKDLLTHLQQLVTRNSMKTLIFTLLLLPFTLRANVEVKALLPMNCETSDFNFAAYINSAGYFEDVIAGENSVVVILNYFAASCINAELKSRHEFLNQVEVVDKDGLAMQPQLLVFGDKEQAGIALTFPIEKLYLEKNKRRFRLTIKKNAFFSYRFDLILKK